MVVRNITRRHTREDLCPSETRTSDLHECLVFPRLCLLFCAQDNPPIANVLFTLLLPLSTLSTSMTLGSDLHVFSCLYFY